MLHRSGEKRADWALDGYDRAVEDRVSQDAIRLCPTNEGVRDIRERGPDQTESGSSLSRFSEARGRQRETSDDVSAGRIVGSQRGYEHVKFRVGNQSRK